MASQHPIKSPHWLYNTHFNNPAFSDLILKLRDGKEIHAHRVVLCRRSKYFSKLIAGGFVVSIYNVFNLCGILTH
jgi:hypothetical protein